MLKVGQAVLSALLAWFAGLGMTRSLPGIPRGLHSLLDGSGCHRQEVSLNALALPGSSEIFQRHGSLVSVGQCWKCHIHHPGDFSRLAMY